MHDYRQTDIHTQRLTPLWLWLLSEAENQFLIHLRLIYCRRCCRCCCCRRSSFTLRTVKTRGESGDLGLIKGYNFNRIEKQKVVSSSLSRWKMWKAEGGMKKIYINWRGRSTDWYKEEEGREGEKLLIWLVYTFPSDYALVRVRACVCVCVCVCVNSHTHPCSGDLGLACCVRSCGRTEGCVIWGEGRQVEAGHVCLTTRLWGLDGTRKGRRKWQ